MMMIAQTYHDLKYYQFSLFANLNHAVFTRKGGVSPAPYGPHNVGGTVGDDVQAVRQNHQLMYDALNVNRERTCTVWQVHGADTVIVHAPIRGRRWVALADGMVTDTPDTPLVMRYADCTPILGYDPVRGVIGVAHAGWRGTVLGAARSMVMTMVKAFGSRPADILAGIGPSIGPDRYQVGEEVVSAVQAYYGTLTGDMPEGDLIRRDPTDGNAYLNLWAANRLDLQRAGVEQVQVAGICTASNTDEWHSHRAEKGKTGRFGVVMSL
jgi:YfiH family protein